MMCFGVAGSGGTQLFFGGRPGTQTFMGRLLQSRGGRASTSGCGNRGGGHGMTSIYIIIMSGFVWEKHLVNLTKIRNIPSTRRVQNRAQTRAQPKTTVSTRASSITRNAEEHKSGAKAFPVCHM